MNREAVRCWPLTLPNGDGRREDGHWITYPEDNSGHDLVSCTNCGHVYAVNIAKLVYVGPPLAEKIKTLNCLCCGKALSEFMRSYPETCRDRLGHILTFERPLEIPANGESQVVEFDQIY